MEKLEINRDLELLIKKVEDIENFLDRRTRGIMEGANPDRCC